MTSESSSGDEASDPKPNPITKPPEDQLSALALSDTDGQENGVVYETPRGNEIENEEEAALTNSAPPGPAEAEESSEGGGGGGGGGGIVWARTNSEVEVDGPESPSSSGYAGGRGSSSASSDGSGIDEIAEVRNHGVVDGVSEAQTPWVPGKRHVDEVLWSSNSFMYLLCIFVA